MTLRRKAYTMVVALGVATGSMATTGEGGEGMYSKQCAACHGIDRQGIEGFGVSLVNSDFVQSAATEDLVAFLKVGRMPNDSASITRGVMPGFAWMTEEDLNSLANYLAASELGP